MSLKGKIEITGLTDVGSIRDQNEDAISKDERLGLAVLADGMGGHRGGEMASAMTVSTIVEILNKKLKKIDPGKSDPDTGYSQESMAIHEAITQANTEVHNAANASPQYQGMGTTVVVLLFYDNRFTVAHVGDSRLYRLRDGDLEQITSDHSLTQELLDRGFYTADQAQKSTNKNLVTRAVGIEPFVQIDLMEASAQVDDIYLLCSDGLSDLIDDTLILGILKKYGKDLDQAAAELIREANEHGGKDNISAILARPVKPFPARDSLFSRFFDLFS